MKSVLTTTVTSLALGLSAVTAAEAPHGDPYIPTGKLHVSRQMVRTGVKPLLSWEITYPTKIDDIIIIGDDDEIIPKVRTLMEVRVVGAAFQVGSRHTPISLDARVGTGSSWQHLFLGTDSAPDASTVLLRQIVEPGTRIDFAAQAQNGSGSWYSSRNTLSADPTVQALTNGASVPSYVPAYDQDTAESFLSQYISSENVVTVGPRDVVYLFELYSNEPSSSYFDMQDIVVVVTFHDVPE
jgi:hypothetical protein